MGFFRHDCQLMSEDGKTCRIINKGNECHHYRNQLCHFPILEVKLVFESPPVQKYKQIEVQIRVPKTESRY